MNSFDYWVCMFVSSIVKITPDIIYVYSDKPATNGKYRRVSQLVGYVDTDSDDGILTCTPYNELTNISGDKSPFDLSLKFDGSSGSKTSITIPQFVPITPLMIPLNIDNNEHESKTPTTPAHDNAPSMALQVIKCLQKIEYYFPNRLSDWVYTCDNTNRFELNYVFIKNCHLIWNSSIVTSDDECTLSNYDGYISLLSVKDIKRDNKQTSNFIINAYNIKSSKYNKTYTFKCDNQTDRDKWINDLNNYINKINSSINDIDNSLLDIQ